MKCPECDYTSFDYLEECRKCGTSLSPIPVFKYLYEDELSAEAAIGGSGFLVAEDVPAGAGAAGAAFELSPAGELQYEELSGGKLEDFLAFERGLSGEIAQQEEQPEEKGQREKESPPPLPHGMIPATFAERFFAFSVDFLFTLCVTAAALFSGATLIGETFFPGFGEFVSIWGWICLCAYALATTYFIFLPSWCGTTLGNSVAGIRVVMRDGSPTGFRTNLLRWVGWIFSVVSVFAGFALSTLDPQRKTLSDRLCGTFVVRA